MRRIGLFLFLMLAIAASAGAQTANTISTYAGGGPNTGSATAADLPQVYAAVRDNSGNTYISDPSLGIVYKVSTGGTISVYAGNGVLGFSGDGGPAAQAQLGEPEGLALDSQGNLYIADAVNNRIRVVTTAGIISTLAGSGTEYDGAGFFGGYSGDGGEATSAFLNYPTGVAVDSSNNVYIADRNNTVIRVVSGLTGIITTFAGNGVAGYSGDGGAATSAELNSPRGVTTDSSGNVYIADRNNCIVRMVNISTQIITTYAGTPATCSYGGDGGAATSAYLGFPDGVFMDPAGNLLIADTYNYRVRKVDNTSQHNISTIAGNGNACTSAPTACGDGGAPTSATLNIPASVFLDSAGITLIADSGDMRVRTVSAGASPLITNYAGSGNGGDGGAATSAILGLPYIVSVDGLGNLFTLEARGERLRRVDVTTQKVTTTAGNGVEGVSGSTNGNNGPATGASFVFPIGMTIDGTGNIYIVDQQEYVVWKINADSQNISIIAGDGAQCSSSGTNPNNLFPACGDGGPATSASLCYPAGVAVDASGNVYISDQCLNRIRKIDTDGNISNFAGNLDNNYGYSGDGGLPTAALLNDPFGIAFSPAGDLYIADTENNVIRVVYFEENIISTYAFNGEPTFGGDGGSALDASMFNPTEVAFDAAGNLFVGGGNDNVVQRIDVNDTSVITVAGNVDNLDGGFAGDGGPPNKALIENFGLAVDGNENLYIADAGSNRIRTVHMVPVATWTPSTLTFPPTLQGQQSDYQYIIFSNTGFNDLTVNPQTTPTDYLVQGCVAPPLGSCTVDVSLQPAVGGPTGTVSGTLVLTTTDPNNPTASISLSGTVPTIGFTLSVINAGIGAGSVYSDPSESTVLGSYYIECSTGSSAGCSGAFASGAVVTLTAIGSAGSGFTGWTGPCTPVADIPYECTVTMSQAQSVTATFGTESLIVALAGNGTGTITVTPPGTICSSFPCTVTIPLGTQQVTLAATANTGSLFAGWMDEFCTNTTGSTCVLYPTSLLNEQATAVFTVPRKAFTKGDVFVGTTSGMIFEYSSTGTLVQVLPSFNFNSFTGYIFGMAFDASGNLYATNPIANAVETFSADGVGPSQFAATYTPFADSIRIVGDNIFVGLDTSVSSGNLLEFFDAQTPPVGFYPAYQANSGIGPFEVAQDNVTVFYTLAGPSVYSFNSALGLQNPDLTDSLPGTVAYDLRQLPDQSLLVADGDRVVRLNTSGTVIQTYQPATFALLLGLTLDADGVDFWTNDSITGIVYKINISSGAIVSQFSTGLAQNTFAGIIGFGGLAIYGSPATGGQDLTVSLAGTGAGTVSSSPSGITCPTTICTANFAVGQVVTLTAMPGTGSTFAGFSSNCTAVTSTSCTIAMSVAQAVTATFNTGVTYTLTVMDAGTGTGTVTSQAGLSPAIDCISGSTTGCMANYNPETDVTLTASGSTFTGFSSNCYPLTSTSCTVTMDAAETVTATFGAATFAVTVDEVGSGTGTVTSQSGLIPAINCPTITCTGNYPSETIVTLTPKASSGSTFTGWTDATCEGTGPCSFTVSAAVTVKPQFTANNFTLTVSTAGTGGGTVTSQSGLSPAIYCTGGSSSGGCVENYPSGTMVVLMAMANDGSVFAGWSGNASCSGTGTCTVTMNAAESVTATFNIPPPNYTLAVSIGQPSSGSGTGTGTVRSQSGLSPAIDCTGGSSSGGCTESYPSGTVVTLTATPGTGSGFAGWSGACSGTGTCVVTMNGPESVTATFNTSTFTFTTGPGYSTTVDTTPGGNIVVGFTLSSTTATTVGLGCASSAPQYLSCLITPSEVSLTGNGPSQVAVVLTSYCQGNVPGAPEGPTPGMPGGVVGVMLLGMALCGVAWSYRGRRRWALSFAVMLLATVGGGACNNLPKGTAGATPPNIYTLTITATVAGQAPQIIQINVDVK
jgi:sugar lactone lactonase YvrE